MTESSDTTELVGFAPVDLYQKREKIITRHVSGKYQKLRFFTGWPMLLAYFGTPWLEWGDRQAVLLDLPARQFHIFFLNIWPQDLWLLGWLLMIAAFALFTVTNIVGRLWCGYTCPQTVWTAIYMWIEQKSEGTRHQRVRLDAEPWSISKIKKRTQKHIMWLGFAFFTAFSFVGYFTPIRELTLDFITLNVAAIDSWTMFWLAFFTAATYINAGWMREQICIYMCPYARFQSAMIDRDTLIVSYDPDRGEPRSSRKRGAAADEGAGDCIDCQLCVQVCPTGIDIRDGLQYQCIGCAACIDACNEVMGKMSSAPNLVSYTTLNALDGGRIRWLRPRSVGYGFVCLAIMSVFLFVLFNRVPMELDILRDRGSLYDLRTDGSIDNAYQLKVMNKTHDPQSYRLNVITPDWISIRSAREVSVEPQGNIDIPLTLTTDSDTTYQSNVVVLIELCRTASTQCIQEETRFIQPSGGQS